MNSFGQAFFSFATVFAFGGYVHAAELKEIGRISVPGEKLTSWDISFVDQASQHYFLADHSNRAVDVFDTKENKFLGRIAGFAGRVIENGQWNRTKSGPNGVTASIDQAWAGDGDSTLKFIDLKAMKITDAVSTGASTRVDNVRLDPRMTLSSPSTVPRIRPLRRSSRRNRTISSSPSSSFPTQRTGPTGQ